MFIEGSCFAKDLPVAIKNAVLKDDTSLAIPAPLWKMVSSNVGTTVNDDGYVFQPVDGSKLFWGVKSEVGSFEVDASRWNYGYRSFVANNYTPGAQGVNGTFEGYLYEGMPVFYHNAWSGYTNDNTPLKYWISVKKDRVIVTYKTDIKHTYARTNVMYFGKPLMYFHPQDTGLVLGSAMSYRYKGNGALRMTQIVGAISTHDCRTDLSAKNKVWGNLIMPSTIMLDNVSTGYRGVLDMFIVNYDGNFRDIDNVRIDGIDYLAVRLPHFTDIWWGANETLENNFTKASVDTMLLIAKD